MIILISFSLMMEEKNKKKDYPIKLVLVLGTHISMVIRT